MAANAFATVLEEAASPSFGPMLRGATRLLTDINVTSDDVFIASVDGRYVVLGPISNLYNLQSYTVGIGFVVLSAFFIFLMQLGWAQMEAGVSPVTDVQMIFMKNIADTSIAALAFYIVGFSLAFGTSAIPGVPLAFAGSGSFALRKVRRHYQFFTQFSYLNNASTCYHGAVAGRMRFLGYVMVTIQLGAVVYPIAAHWVWAPEGWLRQYGVIDYAGASVVDVLGGSIGLAGTLVLGPRIGFGGKAVERRMAHNKPMAASGAYHLWVGGMSFLTLVSAQIPAAYQAEVVGRVAVVALMSTSCSVLTVFVLRRLQGESYDLVWQLYGLLAGIVSVTACCACIDIWASMVIGVIGAIVMLCSAWLLKRARVDDPLQAISVHLSCGLWSLIAAGLFSVPDFRRQTDGLIHQSGSQSDSLGGVFYGGQPSAVGIQLLAALAVSAWAFVLVGALFLTMHRHGMLRISRETELGGLDLFKHESSAYPSFAVLHHSPDAGDPVDSHSAEVQSQASVNHTNTGTGAGGPRKRGGIDGVFSGPRDSSGTSYAARGIMPPSYQSSSLGAANHSKRTEQWNRAGCTHGLDIPLDAADQPQETRQMQRLSSTRARSPVAGHSAGAAASSEGEESVARPDSVHVRYMEAHSGPALHTGLCNLYGVEESRHRPRWMPDVVVDDDDSVVTSVSKAAELRRARSAGDGERCSPALAPVYPEPGPDHMAMAAADEGHADHQHGYAGSAGTALGHTPSRVHFSPPGLPGACGCRQCLARAHAMHQAYLTMYHYFQHMEPQRPGPQDQGLYRGPQPSPSFHHGHGGEEDSGARPRSTHGRRDEATMQEAGQEAALTRGSSRPRYERSDGAVSHMSIPSTPRSPRASKRDLEEDEQSVAQDRGDGRGRAAEAPPTTA